jgi:hypothetical protein
MKRGKVQTNEYGVNVLVEHEDCSSRHYSHLDFEVMCEKMTEEEINEEFSKVRFTLVDKKNVLMKVEGFASSNVSNQNNILYNDLFKYKKKK